MKQHGACQWHTNTPMSVHLHDTGNGCAATNTQRSWNQWLQCQKNMAARWPRTGSSVDWAAGGRPCSLQLSSSVRQPLQKLSFRAPWRVGNSIVGRGNAGGTKAKIEHPWLCQNRSQWPSAVQQAGRESLLNCLSRPPDDPISQETEMNWTD